MARTRGAKSSSPSSRKRVPRGRSDPTSEPPRPKLFPLGESRAKPPGVMLTQPPIEGIWNVELDHFTPRCALTHHLPITAGACAVIPPTAQIPHGAPRLQETSSIPKKVHKRSYRVMPFLFSFQGCAILEHLGYPSEPQLERKRICREVFTLDKWNNMTAYRVEQPERPQPAARRASPRHIPEGIPIASPTIPRAPPVTPASSKPSTSLNQGWPFPFQNTESYAAHCRPSQHLRAALLRRW
ncbi:hypothetical protein AAG906_040100 [Vitis piasezkii]